MFDVKIVSRTTTDTDLISLSEAKKQCLVTHTDDDTYITALISQVRAAVENFCGIAIGEQERVWTADFIGGVERQIPYNPVVSVDQVSVKTDYSTYEVSTVNDDYDVDGQQNLTFTPVSNGRYKVEYTTGYTTLPADLKLGMLMEIAYRYEHRGESNTEGSFSEKAMNYIIRFKDFSFE